MKIAIVCIVLLAPLAARAAVVEIENQTLAARYDASAGRFSFVAKASRKAFVTDGQLEGGPGQAVAQNAADPVFGPGRKIAITQADGSVASLELYGELPFVLIRRSLHNAGKAPTDIQRLAPACFLVELGKAPAELKVMGTAGLLAPDKNPGSYLFLTLADPVTRRGVVAGWLTQDRASGVLFSAVRAGQVEFRSQVDYGHLRIPPGGSEPVETLAVGVFDDARIGQERYADALARQYHVKLHPQLAGYCTWYSEIGGLTDAKGGAGCSNEKDLGTLTEFAARELKPFGFNFVQIDDEWQDGDSKSDGTRINGPRRGFLHSKPGGAYPHGMAPVADMIHRNGLIAGIWFLPFARNHQDREYKDRRDWFVNRPDGTPFETEWGGTSLDLTNPKVQAHLRELARTLRGWGYTYFKMDGLWTGTATDQIYVNDGYKDDHIGAHQPFHDPAVTNIQALRTGLKILRQAAGDDVFFSGCCASQNMRSLAGAIGLVDSMRIGPDNGFGWQDYRNEVMHFEGGGIITGPIRANRLYFLHGRVWWNDPDPAYVRPAVPINHAQLLASWIALAGAFNLNSDWLPGLPPERLDILKRCLPSHHAQARPVDYFDSPMPAIWLLSDSSQSVRRDVLGLYNWDSAAKSIGCPAAKAGLAPDKTYHAFDFWSRSPLPDFKGELRFDVPKESCRIVAVRAEQGHPLLVSTSRHVTQGIVDVTAEAWDAASATLSGRSAMVGGDPCELRIAGLNDGAGWTFARAQVSAADSAAGVTIQPLPTKAGEEGWLRLVVAGNKTNRPVDWSVTFTPGGQESK